MTDDAFLRKLDWNLLKVFHEIVRTGGITRAAEGMGRNQPAVSLSLKRLEDALGVILCRRGPAGFELTDEGQVVAEICAKMGVMAVGLPDRIANLADEVRGRVRIQLISSIVNAAFDRALAEFHSRYPQVEIVIDVTTWDAVGRSLLRNELDIGIAPARFNHAELRYSLLFREIHRPYCGPHHPLFGVILSDPAELAGHPFILTGADEPDELTKYRVRHGIGMRVAGLSEHLDEAKRLTVLGVGLCFLPEAYAAPDVDKGILWPVLPSSAELSMEIHLITNPQAPPNLARELLMDLLERQRLESYPAPPGAAPKH